MHRNFAWLPLTLEMRMFLAHPRIGVTEFKFAAHIEYGGEKRLHVHQVLHQYFIRFEFRCKDTVAKNVV